METNAESEISYYREIAVINEAHRIFLVQHPDTKKIYIKKILDIYNYDVYLHLRRAPIAGIPRIYALRQEQDTLTLIEEYISGDTLEELLERGERFSTGEIRRIALRLCSILSALHTQSPPMIHRDVKPSNVILTPSGEVFLLDLNAAKYLDPSKETDTRLLGTKGYAAPEQYGFGVSDPRTDIYALGMLLRELCDAGGATAPRDELPQVIEKCIRLDPNDRYSSVEELRVALQGREPLDSPPAQARVLPVHPLLPPGFRSLRPFSMFASTIGYLFLFWLCLSLKVKDASTPFLLWLNRIFCLCALLSVIFFSADWMHIRSALPLCRSKSLPLRILGALLGNILLVFFWLLLLAILEGILA